MIEKVTKAELAKIRRDLKFDCEQLITKIELQEQQEKNEYQEFLLYAEALLIDAEIRNLNSISDNM